MTTTTQPDPSGADSDGPTLTTARFRTADLHTYHRNARRGDVAAIAQSLRVNGQYRAIVVNVGTHTGRPYEVLAGNHTLVGARELGWEFIDATTVDVDEDRAARIVAADNRTADLGDYDDRLLAELLGSLPDLDGTGYEPGDLEAIVAGLEAADREGAEDGDQSILDETDEAAWPVIRAKCPPDVHARWRDVPGDEDIDRIKHLLNTAGY